MSDFGYFILITLIIFVVSIVIAVILGLKEGKSRAAARKINFIYPCERWWDDR